MKLERQIISNLLQESTYGKKFTPHLDTDYFEDASESLIFDCIRKYAEKYGRQPPRNAISIELEARHDVTEAIIESARDALATLPDPITDIEWLEDSTREFIRDRALNNAINEAIVIYGGEHKSLKRDAIPDLLIKALGITIDEKIGHDWAEDAQERYDFYHSDQDRLPFKLAMLNKITGGGCPRKTLTIFVAGTNVGKSIRLCDESAYWLSIGKNVLYLTAEMAEERIAERIDANLMRIPVDQVSQLPQDSFLERVQKINKQSSGRLVIKEYPNSSAHVGHVRALLTELKIKKSFVPDVIVVDYLNIFASARFKGSDNMYSYNKSIAEEFRGLAVEQDVPVVSAVQLNRSGQVDQDPSLDSISESHGISMTADLMVGLISVPEFEERGMLLCKQLKNRMGDRSKPERFLIGIDRARMTMYDVDHDMPGAAGAVTNDPVPDQPPADPQGRNMAGFGKLRT